MDTQKIGRFLKALRTEAGMTQEQLGQQLGVTNKTVSRWETGAYLPPVECLRLLSDLYGITINEILSGERLNSECYKDAAEENIAAALVSSEARQRRFERIMYIFLIVTTVITCAILFLLPDGDGMTTTERLKLFAVTVLVLAMAFISNTLNMLAFVLSKDRHR